MTITTRLVASGESGPQSFPEPARTSATLERVLSRFREVALRAGAAHGLSGADLDEVMQDVRIRLWRAAETAGKLETLKSSYVYRTAASAALDLLRRRRARREQPIDDLQPDDLTGSVPVPTPDRALIADETAAAVGAALEELVPNRRVVVRMHLAGYDREEIANLLRWSEAKTRNLLYRGLDDLRHRLLSRGIGPRGMS